VERHKIHLYFRHYVHDEDTLARYKKIVNRVNRATRLTDFVFNISVSYDPNMSVHLKDEVNRISVKLIENNVEFSVKVAHGAGFSLFNIIEENLSNMSVDRKSFFVCCVDGDSYPIDDVGFLRQVRKVVDDMVRENAILGLAQRTKIILPGASELYREIDEMVFALCLRGKLPVKKSVLLKIPPAYAEFGDPVPGFYCLNMTHPKIGDLFRNMEEDMVKSDMTHFTGDFYLVLAAAQMGKIVTDIVPLEDNPPGSFSIESIKSKSSELGKTSLRKVYLAGVKSEENRKLLEKYYPSEDVEKVRETILKAMLR
jgi:hypothetical protein